MSIFGLQVATSTAVNAQQAVNGRPSLALAARRMLTSARASLDLAGAAAERARQDTSRQDALHAAFSVPAPSGR